MFQVVLMNVFKYVFLNVYQSIEVYVMNAIYLLFLTAKIITGIWNLS